ncbi:unnamed protein product [Orchesella dallaii]|uniref:Long-chain-fatty-acid--CoA ligase n=2 Tax=Orchesella dallaii TaxID=48710 RepID=A0ABP1R318_9HEXA
MAVLGFGLGALLYLFYCLVLGALTVLAVRNLKLVYALVLTLPRDVVATYRYLKTHAFTRWTSFRNETMFSMFDKQVKKHPRKVCWYFEDQVWTFKQVQDMSYRVANYFREQGFKKGDKIALIMENRPEYPIMWLGLSRIGVTTALINWNLRYKSLEHCIKIVNCKAVIYDEDLSNAIQEIYDCGGLKELKLYNMESNRPEGEHKAHEPIPQSVNLSAELKEASSDPAKCKEKIDKYDPLVYIYTSGTTGLPKAAILKHHRAIMFSALYIFQDIRPDDVLMTPIPLYHAQGGMIGVGLAFCHGVTQVIVRKFSASGFWKQCVKYDVTVCQYMGEIIRYLYNQPECPEEKRHCVRFFYGNGVNLEIWKKFVDRFKGIKIQEMYGSTEGNVTLINFEGKWGAVGCIPIWYWPFVPCGMVKINEVNGEILRDPKTGLGIQCKPNEVGEMIGVIVRGDPLREFDGYTDEDASHSKIAHNVLSKGDTVFRTGDLIVRDIYNYFYFKDRLGDTYRWKGENVSTTEVEGIVQKSSGLKAAVVYGVKIPGTEGKCGMAAIEDPEDCLNLDEFSKEITKALPVYARPIFLRVMKGITITGTYKLQKIELQREAFDIDKIKDKLLFLENGTYVPLSRELHGKIVSGQVRV